MATSETSTNMEEATPISLAATEENGFSIRFQSCLRAGPKAMPWNNASFSSVSIWKIQIRHTQGGNDNCVCFQSGNITIEPFFAVPLWSLREINLTSWILVTSKKKPQKTQNKLMWFFYFGKVWWIVICNNSAENKYTANRMMSWEKMWFKDAGGHDCTQLDAKTAPCLQPQQLLWIHMNLF